MRRYIITLIIAAMAMLTALPADAQTDTLRRKKVGLVLSGGGAKGMAHIGVLHVLEKAGIPVDIITGTSMGALIGGLYSIGYDAATLDSLVMAQNWNSLLSDRVDIKGQSLAERDKQNTYILSRPLTIAKRVRNASGGLIVGTNLSKLFARLTMGWHDSIDFARLPIPFACVATDIATNTEHDFYGGYLQQAMRASMAIPGVFTPVRVDSMVLVDGGLRNNYPADIARQMGADVIIGVSVQSDDKTADELKSAPDILMQIVDINCKNKLEENWAMTDIPIKVNVKGYSSASFSQTAIDSLIERGEQAAMEHWSGLVMLKRSLGIADDYKPTRKTKSVPLQEALNVRVDTVEFENIEPADSRFVMTKYRLSGKDSIPVRRIEQAVTLLSNDFLYTGADYSLTKQREGYVLRMSAKDKRTSRVNLGVRFDTEETVALQANLTHQIKTRIPINTAFTGRLGKRMMARLDADINPLHYSKIGFTYELRHDDVNIYDRGDRAYSFTYNRHRLAFNVFSLDFRNISMDIGVKADFYDFHDVLTGSAGNNELSNEHLYSYHFNLNYNSEDKWFFTTRGAYFTAGFGYYTDNFISWKERGGISAVDALWRMSFSLNSRFTLQPMVYGRMLFGDNIPLIMHNALGGDVAGRYFEQQMPFAGVGHVEFVDDKLIACQLRAQQRIVDNNYVILKMSLAQRGETLKTMFDKGLIFGCEAAYYYNSMFGPIGASLGYSNRTNHPYLYVNLGFNF